MSPDKRQHRGAHPADKTLFAPEKLAGLRAATADLSWLLTRSYATKAALKLVGDQYSLTERQRLAVSRAACSDSQNRERRSRSLPVESIEGEEIFVDGFNLIITIEAALGGGVILRCRDSCLRDLSSVHGSYRSVLETARAISLAGEALAALKPAAVHWFLDKPVSNSGRLAQKIREVAEQRAWPWDVAVVFNPDTALSSTDKVVVTSDSLILDRAQAWVNLNDYLVRQFIPPAWIVDLDN